MCRYIRAEDLMNNNPVGLSIDSMAQWAEYIAELPDADVRENTKGKWLKIWQNTDYTAYECSNCGAGIRQSKGVTRMPNYCNKCGLDMRENEDVGEGMSKTEQRKRYIDADKLEEFFRNTRREMKPENYTSADAFHTMDGALLNMEQIVHLMEGEDVVGVVRCKDCINAVEPDKHAELNSAVLHCMAYRGEEVRHVWHKYKKYYKDYSLVFDDEYCSFGVRKDG